MKLAVIGNGRMGRMIASVCGDDFEVAGFVGPGDHAHADEIADAQVMIDFSYPGNLEMVLQSAVNRKLPLVIGTTGLTLEQGDAIRAASDMIPIVWANNFSTGVTVLARLARMAAQALGEDFDIEITETHHNQKEDAPSGTAKMLLEAVDPNGENDVVNGREGRPGKRGREIGMHALRGGTVAGTHSVHFFGPDEELEFTHRAASRQIFVNGALHMARILPGKPNGVYDLQKVLFGD